MDLNDLKKTWDLMPTSRELDENQLHNMLGSRTKSLIERIDRNIKIGFMILLGLILLLSFDDFWFSPETIKESFSAMPVPNWVIFLAVFGNILRNAQNYGFYSSLSTNNIIIGFFESDEI